MILRIAAAFFLLGLVALPFSSGRFAGLPTLLCCVSATLAGLHAYRKAERLAEGQYAFVMFCRLLPVVLPLSLIVVYEIAR